MLRDDLEFRIALYADGTLPPSQRAALEAEIAGNAEAQAVLAQYQKLNAALARTPGPEIYWDVSEKGMVAAIAEATPAEFSPADDAPLDDKTQLAISCLADGTLPAEDEERIEHLIDSDERARAVYDEHLDVIATTRAICHASPNPLADEHLAARISAGVTTGSAAVAAMSGLTERLIADYAAGELSTADRAAAEAQLDADPAARVVLSEYAAVDHLLRSVKALEPVPAVKWDALAERISAALDAEPAEAAVKPTERQHGSYPIWRYFTRPMGLSIAAMIAVAIGVSVFVAHRAAQVTPLVVAPIAQPVIAQVQAPHVEIPAGPVVDEVTVGPPKFAGAQDETNDVVSHRTRAFVSSGQSTPRVEAAMSGNPF